MRHLGFGGLPGPRFVRTTVSKLQEAEPHSQHSTCAAHASEHPVEPSSRSMVVHHMCRACQDSGRWNDSDVPVTRKAKHDAHSHLQHGLSPKRASRAHAGCSAWSRRGLQPGSRSPARWCTTCPRRCRCCRRCGHFALGLVSVSFQPASVGSGRRRGHANPEHAGARLIRRVGRRRFAPVDGGPGGRHRRRRVSPRLSGSCSGSHRLAALSGPARGTRRLCSSTVQIRPVPGCWGRQLGRFGSASARPRPDLALTGGPGRGGCRRFGGF